MSIHPNNKVYHELFENSVHAIILQDMNGKFKVFNKKATFLGYTIEELLKLKIEDVDIIRTPKEIKKQYKYIIKQGKNIEFETKLQTKNREVRNVHISCNVLEINGKKYIQNIILDITERRREEDDRQASRDKLNDNLKKRTVESKKRMRIY